MVRPLQTKPAGSVLAERAWQVLAGVSDPEIPAISVVDLGIVRAVVETGNGVEVRVTPTYAGCPATHVIEADITAALGAAGIAARVVTTLSPPWTTDWISAQGRARLRQYGIAPPGTVDRRGPQVVHLVRKMGSDPIYCPRCESGRTELLSQFGSTACKALYRCVDCREPFDYFKPL